MKSKYSPGLSDERDLFLFLVSIGWLFVSTHPAGINYTRAIGVSLQNRLTHEEEVASFSYKYEKEDGGRPV